MTRVTGTGVPKMKMLGARVKEAGPTLTRELRRNLKDVAEPLADRARKSVLAMPSHHDGTLRGELAGTVRVGTQIAKSGIKVSIVSLGSRMPPGKGNLNGYTDSPRGWRHPVFGSSEAENLGTRGHGRGWVWVKQYGKPGWFENTIAEAARHDAGNASQRAVDATARRLSS